MQITNERLAELIAETRSTAKNWKAFDADQSSKNPDYESIVQGKCDDLLTCLVDYQAMRSAAAAGVEEAAAKLVKFVAAKISEWLPGELDLPQDDAQAIRDFLGRLLAAERAKYETRIAELNKHLQDAANKVGEQATTIAKQGAALEECRAEVTALESQLAQLAAERDVLGKVEAMLRADYDLEVSCGATVITADEWHIYVAAHDIGGDQGKSSVVRPTLLAALAALVAAAGREESK